MQEILPHEGGGNSSIQSGIEAPLPSFSKKFTVEDVQASTDKNDPSTIKINIKGEAKNISFPIKLPFKAEATNPSNTNPLSQAEPSAAVAIEDKDGGVYEVDDKGKAKKIGNKGSELPPIEYKEAARKMNVRLGRATTPKLLFKALASEPLAFDEWQENFKGKSIIEKEYQKIGENYYVPNKFIPQGMTGKVQVDLNGINKDSVIFKTPNGSIYTLQENNILSIAGAKNGDGIELYAQNKFDSKIIYGKLNIYGYEIKNLKVNLVPVNSTTTIDKVKLENELNKIYYPYGVSIKINIEDSLQYGLPDTWDLNYDEKLNTGTSKFLNRYTDEMSELNYMFSKEQAIDFKNDNIYLFLLNKASDENVVGDMPIKSQFGYLFGNINAQTIAHEIAHGFFQLEHTFDDKYKIAEGTTNNLMDYNNGNKLYKFQWDLVHDRGLKLFSFLADSSNGKKIKTDISFDSSAYSQVFKNLMENNEIYRKKILEKYDTEDSIFNFYLTFNDELIEKEDAFGITKILPKVKWEKRLILEGTQAPNFDKNGKMIVESKIKPVKQRHIWILVKADIQSIYDNISHDTITKKTKVLSKVGMALVLIHEAIHGMMKLTNDEYFETNNHNIFADKYRQLLLAALIEYVNDNNLAGIYSNTTLEMLCILGLSGSDYYHKTFIPQKMKEWQLKTAEKTEKVLNKKLSDLIYE